MSARGWNPGRSRQWLSHFAQVGDDPLLLGRPSIGARPDQLRIGDRFRMASRPVGSHLAVGDHATLHIGNDVWIGHGAAIASHEQVEIGDGTRLGSFVIIMDSNFHSGAGDQSEQHDCRPVIIGRACRIGSRVTITRGARIGDGAQILAGSVVSGDIPPGVCAGGARARVLGRAGEILSRGHDAALSLPALLADVLALDAVPDMSGQVIPEDRWTDARIQLLRDAISSRLRVEVGIDTLQPLRNVADIGALVQRALDARA